MGSQAELSLDYKPNNNYLIIQKAQGDQPVDQTEKIQDFLTKLEEERLKIEAFKRELPLCMQLLNNAEETCRQQLEMFQSKQGSKPVLEEFIPSKNTEVNGSDKHPNASSEKASWMVSAQLWSQANDAANSNQQQQQFVTYNSTNAPATVKEEAMASPKLSLIENKTRNGGAFLPFSKDKNKVSSVSTIVAASKGLPELALASPELKSCSAEDKSEHHETNSYSGIMQVARRRDVVIGSKNGGEAQAKQSSNSADGQATPQTHRKARRCWSPDLHRRFVNALQILGGSQVATPKQIRELMKVDGLTNDEVKSHLQKYRLHTRRPIPVPQHTSTATPQLVVLGGIWVPPEYATSAAAAPTLFAAHPAAPHYCTPTQVPPDFYTAYHHVPQPLAVHRTVDEHRGGASRSPESEQRSDGERSESVEEEDDEDEDEENLDEEVVENAGKEKKGQGMCV